MGGIEVDPDSAGASVPGLFAAGECSGGMHGSNRLGGNSLSDLLVFGRRAGLGAAEYVAGPDQAPTVRQSDVDRATRAALAPFGRGTETNPYAVHAQLQQTMNDLVGIIRTASEMEQALEELGRLAGLAARVGVEGHRQFNPGWHLAIDLRNMLMVSECVAKAALKRTESRGGHTREDFPRMSPTWRNTLVVCTAVGDTVVVAPAEQTPMRKDLFALFDLDEVEKYYTATEVATHPHAT